MTSFITNWLRTKAISLIIAQVKAWLFSQKWYRDLLMKIMPKLRLSTYYSEPNNENYKRWGALCRKGYKHLQPGDIILTLDNKKIASMIISKATADKDGGKEFVPSHAALCVAKDPESSFEVAEMTHHDFTESTWEDVCYESTRVVIIRCIDWDEDYIKNQVIPTCLSFDDKKYDIEFQQGKEELICSELVYFSDPERRLDVDLDPVIGFDPYISPMGLLNGRNIEVIWDSKQEK